MSSSVPCFGEPNSKLGVGERAIFHTHRHRICRSPRPFLIFLSSPPPPLRVPKIITSTYVFDHILTHFASREKLNESTHPSFKLKDNPLAPEAAPEGGGGGANGDANGSAGAMGGGGS